MSVSVTDNRRQAVARAENAAQLGLAAAANVLRNAVVKEFGSNYYKGGAFRSTLFVKQRTYYLTPYRSSDGGGWETQVGTPVMQALYWELGHHNTFTRKYERVRIWEPAGLASTGAMRSAYARVVARVMGAA
jgi:hypothetical protein